MEVERKPHTRTTHSHFSQKAKKTAKQAKDIIRNSTATDVIKNEHNWYERSHYYQNEWS